MIFENPEAYGLTKAELNDTSSSDAIRIMESRFPNLSSGGGKKGKKRGKKKGGSYIEDYLAKINSGGNEKNN